MSGKSNIILIGMPGSGKSTVGVVLAKELGYSFLDSDLLIQQTVGKKLQAILDERGQDGFLTLEEEVNCGIDVDHTVIATGGSVIFGPKAMAHLATQGTIIHLDVSPAALEERLANLRTRGVVMKPGQTIADVYNIRTPLYLKYAHKTIHTDGMKLEQVVDLLAELCREQEESHG